MAAHIPGTPMFTLIGEQGRANRQIQEYCLHLTKFQKTCRLGGWRACSGKTAVAIEAYN